MHDQALGANIQTHIRAWTIRLFKTIKPPAHAPDASCANVSEHAEFVCEAARLMKLNTSPTKNNIKDSVSSKEALHSFVALKSTAHLGGHTIKFKTDNS